MAPLGGLPLMGPILDAAIKGCPVLHGLHNCIQEEPIALGLQEPDIPYINCMIVR